MITTTLAEIESHGPCKPGWKKCLKHLGKTKADDAPLPLTTILESNGFNDTLWVLAHVADPMIPRNWYADIAEDVLSLDIYDDRPARAIALVRDPKASRGELRNVAYAAIYATDAACTYSADHYAACAAVYACRAGAARADCADHYAARAAAYARRAGADPDWQIARLRQYLEHGLAAKDMEAAS